MLTADSMCLALSEPKALREAFARGGTEVSDISVGFVHFLKCSRGGVGQCGTAWRSPPSLPPAAPCLPVGGLAVALGLGGKGGGPCVVLASRAVPGTLPIEELAEGEQN